MRLTKERELDLGYASNDRSLTEAEVFELLSELDALREERKVLIDTLEFKNSYLDLIKDRCQCEEFNELCGCSTEMKEMAKRALKYSP